MTATQNIEIYFLISRHDGDRGLILSEKEYNEMEEDEEVIVITTGSYDHCIGWKSN